MNGPIHGNDAGSARPGARSVVIAQITDLHVRADPVSAFGSVDTGERLERVVDAIMSLDERPDTVIITGDLVDYGTMAEYARLQHILSRLSMPVFPIPGNHDDRRNLIASFPILAGRLENCFVQYIVDEFPVRLVGLDTLSPGQVGGTLCERRLRYIERVIASSDKPTLMFMHHPPFDVGQQANPDLSCSNADRLALLLDGQSHVLGVVCGHIHRAVTSRLGQTIAMTVPAVAPMLEMTLSGALPSRWLPSEPGYVLHAWNPVAGMVSTACVAGERAGTQPFS